MGVLLSKVVLRDLTTTQLNARNTKVVTSQPGRDPQCKRRGTASPWLMARVIIERIEHVSPCTYSVDELWIERIVDLLSLTATIEPPLTGMYKASLNRL